MLISGSYLSHKLTLGIFLPFLFYGRVWRFGVCSLKFASIIQQSLMGLEISLWEGLKWVIQFLCFLYVYSKFTFLLVSVSCFYLLKNVCIFHLYYLIFWLYLLIAFIYNFLIPKNDTLSFISDFSNLVSSLSILFNLL